jgi:Uncharacterized protein conserved in bacteria (DUF2255)
MRIVLVGILGVLLCACEPMGPLSGHALSGAATAPPADWTSVGAAETVQLQTRPADPYSVNIWGVALGPDYYVASGRGGNSSWVGHISADPNVQLRIDNSLYDLRAVRVVDPDELARVGAAYAAKYDMDEQDNEPGEAWVFRLDRRT